jgi:release factor glutamine methyltransferase
MILSDLYRANIQLLKEAGVETAALDARLLMQHVLELGQADFITANNHEIVKEKAQEIAKLISRREEGEPVSKIIGIKEFYGRDFITTNDTLDPRPDTETLIDQALKWANGQGKPLSILDLGTGTGCILITLLLELEGAKGTAVDVSPEALEVAKRNAEKHGLDDFVTFFESNWFENVTGKYDLIVSNPPYIPNPDIESLAKEVRNHDPILALDGGEGGINPYKTILSQIKTFLKPEGRAFFEIGYNQQDDITRLIEESESRLVGITPDIAGIPRVVEISIGEK